jgi:hypothetical protein
MIPVEKVIAIGDSFLAGSELQQFDLTWPGLFAKKYNLKYQCLSQPGHTSQYVLRTLFESLSTEIDKCIYIIHWPSAIRFEYVDKENDNWVQLNPNSIIFGNQYSNSIQKLYYQHINSLLLDKWHTLLIIYAAIQALDKTNHQYVLTTVDDFLFDTKFHNPLYVEFLQKACKDKIYWFDNKTFTKWSTDHNFKFGRYGHPLEKAHQAAFEYFEPVFNQLLTYNNK